MKLIRLICTAGVIFALEPSFGLSHVESSGLLQPTIEVDCSLHDIHDEPPDMGAIVKFEWRATNASYVLIKGHDASHHHLTGAIDKSRGGEYTFLAIAGNSVARVPKRCVQNFRRGPGIHGWIVSVDETSGNSRTYFGDAFVVPITTSLAKAQIRDRIAQLLSTNYGVTTVASESDGDDVFLYTADLGFHDALCDRDGCKKNGVEIKRKVGFDIWIEKRSEGQGCPSYKVHILTNIISQPAAGNVEWDTDPDSRPVGVPLTNSVALRIVQLFG